MKIPEPIHANTTDKAIVRWYESKTDERRPHLGASEIGKECARDIWYSFRWVIKKNFQGRILRLFNTGVREEVRILEELRAIGAEVHDRDENGKQINFKTLGDHFGGSCDAIAKGLPEAPKTWAIVEMKTHSDSLFAGLLKKGVKVHKPEHYAQMMVYMGLSDLERALYFAVNKNTDELYTEWVKFDKKEFDALLKKAESIIKHTIPPERISNDPAWFKCKFCDHQKVCHEGQVALKNCRTCAFSTPNLEKGGWDCGFYKRSLDFEEQKIGCRSHLFIPNLIGLAEAVDMGTEWVKYKTKSGLEFFNMQESHEMQIPMDEKHKPVFTSQELQKLTKEILENEAVLTTKTELNAKLTYTEILDNEII